MSFTLPAPFSDVNDTECYDAEACQSGECDSGGTWNVLTLTYVTDAVYDNSSGSQTVPSIIHS